MLKPNLFVATAALLSAFGPSAAMARGYAEYEQCIAPYAAAYGSSMDYCTTRIAPRYGVSSIEYESCVWYAQTPWENAQQWCSDLFLT